MLRELILAYMYSERMSYRDLARVIGVQYVTFFRYAKGQEISGRAMNQIYAWALTWKVSKDGVRKSKNKDV